MDHAPEQVGIPEFQTFDSDWLDFFMMPHGPNSAAAKMTQLTNSEMSPEQQIAEMKEMANHITRCIENEMAQMLSLALFDSEKGKDENGFRKKRSVETPMDSSKLVMRLLKHMKSNNEYQKITIDKMLSAQEIADKFGIEYHPDPEILSEYAIASSKQAEELASIMKDASEMMNVTKEIEFIPIADEPAVKSSENDSYFAYTVHPEDIAAHQNTPPHFEFVPEIIHEHPPVNHHHQHPHYEVHSHYEQHPHYNHHYETQMVPPPHQHNRHPPVSPMPNFFEPFMTFTPVQDYYYPVYYPEPITTTTTIVLPMEESCDPEPELVGEEFEEIMSSKTIVERGDEPGSATVNHVMTYTVSEKSHFRKPQVEDMPQQMQYYFFLM